LLSFAAMGVFGCCATACAIFMLFISLVVGYICRQEHPLGIVFSTVFKLQGVGKPKTDPVPDELKPSLRPKDEMFLELPGGDKMPANGIGMCCRPTAYDPESVRRTVLWFLLQGGRHVDTAAMYLNHEAVGLALKDAEARGVPRRDVFLTTKVWGDSFGYDESIAKANRMLKELGVDYIDLVLLHAPIQISATGIVNFYWSKMLGGGIDVKLSQEPQQVKLRTDTWRGLSTLRDKGLIRNIGVSNFNIKHMADIQALKLAPIAANQMQYHPWLPDWMKEIVDFCHQHKIAVTGYFSLGGWDHKNKALEIQGLNEIAKSQGKRPAQILLRWSLQKNVSIIPGTGNPEHMVENLGTYGFSLTAAEMAQLDSMSSLPISKDFMFIDF